MCRPPRPASATLPTARLRPSQSPGPPVSPLALFRPRLLTFSSRRWPGSARPGPPRCRRAAPAARPRPPSPPCGCGASSGGPGPRMARPRPRPARRPPSARCRRPGPGRGVAVLGLRRHRLEADGFEGRVDRGVDLARGREVALLDVAEDVAQVVPSNGALPVSRQ